MKTFRVAVREVWVNYIDVEAESEEDAFTKVSDAKSTEYSHTLSEDNWTVEELKDVMLEDSSDYKKNSIAPDEYENFWKD
jgi:hypothetical protein